MDDGISRESDDDNLRWYSDGDNRFMSVTTVLNFLDTDDSGLQYWKARNQGEGDDKHWEHIWWYSAPRGTLAHYYCLNPLADREMWDDEERESLQQIAEGPTKPESCPIHMSVNEDCADCTSGNFDEASHDEEDIVYSILHNQDVITDRDTYTELLDHCTLADVALRDLEWVADAFEDVSRRLGIRGNQIAVEHYLLDSTDMYSQESSQSSTRKMGYGGQCDLLYEDPGGNVVMADLKTSSSVREKHLLQAVAYGAAVERTDGLPDTVDRHEVIRVDPDGKDTIVHSHERPDHISADAEWYSTDEWYSDEWGNYEYDSIDDMYDEFTTCVEAAIEQVQDDA